MFALNCVASVAIICIAIRVRTHNSVPYVVLLSRNTGARNQIYC